MGAPTKYDPDYHPRLQELSLGEALRVRVGRWPRGAFKRDGPESKFCEYARPHLEAVLDEIGMGVPFLHNEFVLPGGGGRSDFFGLTNDGRYYMVFEAKASDSCSGNTYDGELCRGIGQLLLYHEQIILSSEDQEQILLCLVGDEDSVLAVNAMQHIGAPLAFFVVGGDGVKVYFNGRWPTD